MAITNRDPNDKDRYANKRVRLAGDLIEDLFRVSLQQLAEILSINWKGTIIEEI